MSSPTAQTCKLIRSQDVFTGKQAFTYRKGVTAENTGSRGLSMHLLTIPPGANAPGPTCTMATRAPSTSSAASPECGTVRT